MSEASEERLLAQGSRLLYREMMLIDEKRWDEWLSLYAPDCEFWMPMWNGEEELNDNPHTALSHMYYQSREGLSDRIVRIRSRRSPASTPAPRTTHLAGNILLLAEPTATSLKLRAAWTCHVFSTRLRDQHVFFGHSEYDLAGAEGGWLIARKKVVLQNDQIPTMLDIYCI